MFHTYRRHRITDVGSFAEMAAKLTENSWTLCTAMRCGRLVAANDSISEDGAQEYAIYLDGRQVESITVSWGITAQRLETLPTELERGGGLPDCWPACPVYEHAEDTCHLCA